MGVVVPLDGGVQATWLSPLAVEDLARSGIAAEAAERAGLFLVDNARTVCRDFKPWPALVIPYFDLAGQVMTYERGSERLPFCRVRYLETPKVVAAFTKAKVQRYAQPAGSPVLPYWPPVTGLNWRAIAEDPTQPCIGIEGEKKALAGALLGLPVFALGGVWNFLKRGALDDILDKKLPEPDLDDFYGSIAEVTGDCSRIYLAKREPSNRH